MHVVQAAHTLPIMQWVDQVELEFTLRFDALALQLKDRNIAKPVDHYKSESPIWHEDKAVLAVRRKLCESVDVILFYYS